MLIKDLQSGTVRKYGSDCHDSLAISQDGRTLSYYNLQCGDGSKYGDFRFVMEDGEVPQDSQTPDAMNCECYFNIGGFDRNLSGNDKQIRDEVIEDIFKDVDDVDMDSNYIYLKFDKEKYSIPNQITRKAELKDWFLEQMKGEQNE